MRNLQNNHRINRGLSYSHFMRIFKGESSPWGKALFTLFKLSGGIGANPNESAFVEDMVSGGKNGSESFARYSQDL